MKPSFRPQTRTRLNNRFPAGWIPVWMPLSHVAPRRHTQRSPEHRDKTRYTFITEIRIDLLDGRAFGHPLHRQHDTKLLSPSTETHAGLTFYQSGECPPAHASAIGPEFHRAPSGRGGHHLLDDIAEATVDGHRQMKTSHLRPRDLVEHYRHHPRRCASLCVEQWQARGSDQQFS